MADPLHRLSGRYVRRFRDTFLASIERIRDQITVEMVARDQAAPDDPHQLFALLDSLDIAKREDKVFAEIVAEAANLAIGRRELREAMTVQSPFVQEAARNLTANLVVGVSNETKKAIRRIIFEAIRDGRAPAVSQKLIRQVVGLTERDAVAVARLAESLSESQLERYSSKLLRRRAFNIARTETLRAGNLGRVEGWKQMARDNLIDTSRFQQRWLTTPDERLCEDCAPMDGMLVDLGGSFTQTERGVLPSERVPVVGETVETPPLHPQCRCTLVADFG